MYWLEQKSSNWIWIMKDLDPVERYHSLDEAKIRLYEIMNKNDNFFDPNKECLRRFNVLSRFTQVDNFLS